MKKIVLMFALLGGIIAVSAQYNVSTAMQYYKRGMLLVQKQNYSNAVEVFSASIKENPNLGIAYYQRGLAKVNSNAKNHSSEFTDAYDDFAKAEQFGVKVPAKYKSKVPDKNK